MKILQSSIVQMAIAGAGLTLIWSGLDALNGNIRSLPIKQVQRSDDQVVAEAVPDIFPVWVTPRRAAPVAHGEELLDAAFGPQASQKEEDVPEVPAYTEALSSTVRVQGTSGNGAFLNGRFYRTGAEVAALAVLSPDGIPVVPLLTSVGDDTVVLSIQGQMVTVKKGGAGWQ